jgi:hypothetical protein
LRASESPTRARAKDAFRHASFDAHTTLVDSHGQGGGDVSKPPEPPLGFGVPDCELPAAALAIPAPQIHVHPRAPEWIWTDSHESLIAMATGCDREGLIDLIRLMEADAQYKQYVWHRSMKRRGVEVRVLKQFLDLRLGGRTCSPGATRAPEPEPPTGAERILMLAGCHRADRDR